MLCYAGEDSPTGTGTLSPLPGHQRSLGRSSSLGDMIESGCYSPPLSPSLGGSAPARPRAGTGGLLERVFGAGGGDIMEGDSLSGNASGTSGEELGSGSGDAGGGISASGRGTSSDQTNGLISEIIARQGQGSGDNSGNGGSGRANYSCSSPDSACDSGGALPGGEDMGIRGNVGGYEKQGLRSSKGKKPPRVPKIKRADGVEGSGAAGGRRGCKVS